MKALKLQDAQGKTPPNHFDMRTFSLFERERGSEDNLALSVSHYLPGGEAAFGPQPVEIFYYVLDGELTVETESGDIVLSAGEAVHVSRGEKKGVKNKTNHTASMLVIAYLSNV